jgi:cytochrome oxidase assembly protein ShyY1
VPDPYPPRPKAYGAPAVALAAIATLAVIALGIVAGRWQFGRYEVRAEAVRAFEAAANVPPAPLTEVLASEGSLDDAEWRSVTARGTFDAGSLTALRGRSVESTAALHYLAWLVTSEGPVLVDVGWVPRDSAADIALPLGSVEIEGVLRSQEADDGRRGDGATRIVAAQLPPPPADAGPPVSGYMMLREPCVDAGCLGTSLKPAPLPQLSLGPHLSYAYQWWLLALLAPFAAVYLVRRDARLELESRGQGAPTATNHERKRSRKQLTDEEVEDAL